MKILAGKTILITRRREQSHELVNEIERRGGKAIVLPMLRIEDPEDWAACDAALGMLSDFDTVIFSSTNSVLQLLRRIEERGLERSMLVGKQIFAVGERTREELIARGIRVNELPERYNAGALLALFGREDKPLKILLPQGNLARKELYEGLTVIGAEVTPVVVYRNLPADEAVAEELKRRFAKGEFHVAAFASPSAVKRFADLISAEEFRAANPRPLMAVIGPTTKQAAVAAGFPVDIEAEVSTSTGLARAIEHYYLKSEISHLKTTA